MSLCHICLDNLDVPVSLPCGHIFCKQCILRAVEAVKQYSSLHTCPECRSFYTVAPLDFTTVPAHLRPYLTPSVRKLYLGPSTEGNGALASSSSSLNTEIARLKAENSALHTNCGLWRRRAEAHSASTMGLIRLAGMARQQTLEVSRERDQLQTQYNTLKQKLNDTESFLYASLQPTINKTVFEHHIMSMYPSGLLPSPDGVLFSRAAVLVPSVATGKRRASDHEEQLPQKRYKSDRSMTPVESSGELESSCNPLRIEE